MTRQGGNRQLRTGVAIAVSALVLAAGCGGGEEDTVDPGSSTGESALSLEEAQAPLKKALPELTSLRDQANEILDEGTEGFDARLAELADAGVPVVVNKWASWCGPCREEFPDFQNQAIERGDEIAFVGLLSDDGPETGGTFLEEFPLPYPSYLDPDKDIAFDRDINQAFPTTLFIDSSGEVAFTKLGPYTSEEQLAADLDKYAQ